MNPRIARRFRIWEKKRGNRQTGSPFLGSAGEAVFFAALAIFGVITWIAIAQSSYLQLDAQGIPQISSWLVVLVLASLIALGVAGLFYTIIRAGTSAERRRALAKKATDIDLLADSLPSPRDYPTVPRDANITNSPGIKLAYRLPIERSPGWKLFAVGLFAVFWNGLVGVLIWLHWQEHPDWILTGLTVPFAILGILAVIYFFYLVLLATAIGPTSLEISSHPIYPGEKYRVFLSQAGRLSVKALTVTLVCEEEATFRQGTDTRTERRRILEQQVFSNESFEILPVAPFENESDLDFPSNVMHSFQSDHNGVHWRLVVSGIVEKWPKFQRNFPLVVYPVHPD